MADTGTVIVALPPVDDRVNKISSEKIAHLTLCYLGDAQLSEEAVLYIQHACAELNPFGFSVDHRGTLGPDDADVLFFKNPDWGMKDVNQFRHYLLLNDEIKRAYDSTEQHPEWIPHLTLGYPTNPANEDPEDHRIYYVDFDRIAVWMGDFEGPEFRLEYPTTGMEMAMSDISTVNRGRDAVGELFHHGVKGQKWGVTTKDRAHMTTPQAAQVTQAKPGKFAKTSGGENHPLHEDAAKALATRQKAKASTTDALSNPELRTAIERMRLEQQFNQLSFSDDRRSRGARFVAGLLGVSKPVKMKDLDEDAGEKIRTAIKEVTKPRDTNAA